MDGRKQLATYLSTHGAEFHVHRHPAAYTARATARSENVPEEAFVKVVVADADGQLVMLCLPASRDVNLAAAAQALEAKHVRLASEEEFGGVFQGCDVGAMPPFGNLYSVPVYVDDTLAADERIEFSAGSHEETFEMYYKDFERLVRPQIAHFSQPR